ncbi:fimbria/pilus outer membrane usher protein [Pantoea allii]|uniref:fimbria/pilus outer membrane usher protein n=1 Tax=Pantoea allii TaxID=574096 RepID=UPI0024B6947A|nr:fimbria/pilus outer membrane usher protein [Pantoea allii]MDJ0034701.1 fimbria/pilus outer membrane usher protein [Pantoea allii]
MKCYGKLALIVLIHFPFQATANYKFNPGLIDSTVSSVADLENFQNGNVIAPGIYLVDIYLNSDYATSAEIKFIEKGKNIVPCFDEKILVAVGINTRDITKPGACIFIEDDIPGSHVNFVPEKLKVEISAPQSVLFNTARGHIPKTRWDHGIPALLLNYRYSGSTGKVNHYDAENHFLALDSGANLGAWRLRNNSTWTFNETHDSRNSEWKNIRTYLQRPLLDFDSIITIGEYSTSNAIYDTFNFRGLQISSDEAMLPDSRRGFAPVVRGIAKTNARVTVKQNNYVVYETYVPPGPFELTDLYATGSSGDLTVNITESDGQVQSYTMPYSSLPVLQREGSIKYSLTSGKYRGLTMQDSPEFFQATLIAGLPYGMSFYGGGQLSDNYKAWSLGLGMNLGFMGAISVDATHAQSTLADKSQHAGNAYKFQYAKSLNTSGTTFQLLSYRFTTDGFYSFSDTTWKKIDGRGFNTDGSLNLDTTYNLRFARKGQLQASLSQDLGEFGSVYLTGLEQTYWNMGKKNTTLQAGFNTTLYDITAGLALSYNRNPWQMETDKRLSLLFSLPLDKFTRNSAPHTARRAWATAGTHYDAKGNYTHSTGINGVALENRNLSYNLQQSYSNNGQAYGGSAGLTYNGAYNAVTSNYSYSKHYRQASIGIDGGVIIHQEGITFGQALGDTNILVDAAGASGLSVENRTGVKTDWRGYTYLPYATAYRNNRIALDQSTLPPDITLEEAVKNTVPTQGALTRAKYDVRKGLQALFTLTQNGKALPLGTLVTVKDPAISSIVGDNGNVFLSGIPESGTLTASWGSRQDQRCNLRFDLANITSNGIIIKKHLRCE